MTCFASTDRGPGRLVGATRDTVELLAIDHPDLGAALLSGMSIHDLAAAGTRETVPLDGLRLLAPIPRPSKIWAVGFGYHDHRAETGHTSEVGEPTIFFKAPSSVIGSGTPIRFPASSPS